MATEQSSPAPPVTIEHYSETGPTTEELEEKIRNLQAENKYLLAREKSTHDYNPLEGMSAPDVKDVIVFPSMDDFFVGLKESRIYISDKLFHDFYTTYEDINEGCGCTRKKRVNLALAKYLELKDLPGATRTMFKAHLNAKKIQLMNGEVLVAEW